MRVIRHKVRGTQYEIVDAAIAQVSTPSIDVFSANAHRPLHDNDVLIVYRSLDDDRLWVRFPDEMVDGRFETLAISNEQPALSSFGETNYFGVLVARARAAAEKATKKFPQPNYVTLKIAEEAGEVVRGAVHYAEGRMPWSEVEGEIVQLLAMLIRFVTEGDEINGVRPPKWEDSRHG